MAVDYRQTKSWQLAVGLSRSLARLVEELPKGEEQGLVMQLQSAMVNLPTVVAIDLARGTDTRTDELARIQAVIAVVEIVYPALDVSEPTANLTAAEQWLLSDQFAQAVKVETPPTLDDVEAESAPTDGEASVVTDSDSQEDHQTAPSDGALEASEVSVPATQESDHSV